MFEYLMPLLVMPPYERTLLDETYRAVVQRQIEYGRERGVPWGISESGYNKTDRDLNYQYKAFGVPGLGSSGVWRRSGGRAVRDGDGADGESIGGVRESAAAGGGGAAGGIRVLRSGGLYGRRDCRRDRRA
jgi:hypothetical protein